MHTLRRTHSVIGRTLPRRTNARLERSTTKGSQSLSMVRKSPQLQVFFFFLLLPCSSFFFLLLPSSSFFFLLLLPCSSSSSSAFWSFLIRTDQETRLAVHPETTTPLSHPTRATLLSVTLERVFARTRHIAAMPIFLKAFATSASTCSRELRDRFERREGDAINAIKKKGISRACYSISSNLKSANQASQLQSLGRSSRQVGFDVRHHINQIDQHLLVL